MDQHGRYGFRHPLAAQAVYHATPEPYRRALHGAAAAVLRHRSPPPVGRLARHCREAGDHQGWIRYAMLAAGRASASGDASGAATLSLGDTTPAGTSQWLTVHAASGKPGSGAEIAGLELEVSYDDGATWAAPSRLVDDGDGVFRALLRHPDLGATSGAVTLRTKAWDTAGNTVAQTLQRAFGLTAPVKPGGGGTSLPE